MLSTFPEFGDVFSVFQPIVSVKSGQTLGAEALSRSRIDGKIVQPAQLFSQAAARGLSLELDECCRIEAFKAFAAHYREDEGLFLFVNADASLLTEGSKNAEAFVRLAGEYGIPTDRVVIEILESSVPDDQSLRDFVRKHRKAGFMIALDDMGIGHSNLERISSLKPDIIKIDRSLISDIHRHYQKQEILDFFLKLAKKIGILVIAEGIETKQEALACLERAAELLQGFYFSRPVPLEPDWLLPCAERIGVISTAFKDYSAAQIQQRKRLFAYYNTIAAEIRGLLNECRETQFDEVLGSRLGNYPEAECAYVLNPSGIQVSKTIFNPERTIRPRSALFSPAEPGDDQSTKDYFICLDRPGGQYVTEPYVSQASGNICVTISAGLEDSCGAEYILCLDINTPFQE